MSLFLFYIEKFFIMFSSKIPTRVKLPSPKS
uniref:Uncharacterized protein n=1 Tax=Siphoviridae sp. ctZHD14 TaxID=2827891 RepID=A0A8S5SXS8_9CAUD|nr:MAG TPA: hypothetical protein [Siphoviridae sp. ctZHD14]